MLAFTSRSKIWRSMSIVSDLYSLFTDSMVCMRRPSMYAVS